MAQSLQKEPSWPLLEILFVFQPGPLNFTKLKILNPQTPKPAQLCNAGAQQTT